MKGWHACVRTREREREREKVFEHLPYTRPKFSLKEKERKRQCEGKRGGPEEEAGMAQEYGYLSGQSGDVRTRSDPKFGSKPVSELGE